MKKRLRVKLDEIMSVHLHSTINSTFVIKSSEGAADIMDYWKSGVIDV